MKFKKIIASILISALLMLPWAHTGFAADQRIAYTEEMVGSGHPTKSDTLNRLAIVEHGNDGTHGKAITALTASQAVFTDGSKILTSNAITGTGNVVMSASPTLTGIPIAPTIAETNLTDGYVPYHISDTSGKTNSNIYTNGTYVMIGDTANINNTKGLTIQQSTADDEIVSLKSSDVGHPFTVYSEADTFFSIGKYTGATGGATIYAFSDGDSQAFMLHALIGSTNPTDATPAITLTGSKSDGSTGGAALGADETVYELNNYTTVLQQVYGDGDAWFVNNVSVLSITDRTLDFTGDAVEAIKGIKSKDGKVDHASLPEFARKVKTRTVEGSKAEISIDNAFENREIEVKKVYETTKNGKKSYHYNQMGETLAGYKIENGKVVEVKKPVYEMEKWIVKKLKGGVEFDNKTGKFYQKQFKQVTEEGRSLGAMISILVKGMQQQQTQIDELKARIEVLEKR